MPKLLSPHLDRESDAGVDRVGLTDEGKIGEGKPDQMQVGDAATESIEIWRSGDAST